MALLLTRPLDAETESLSEYVAEGGYEALRASMAQDKALELVLAASSSRA